MVNFTTVACRISSRLKWYKNYKNRLRLAKVIVKNKMSRFFMVHCVLLFRIIEWLRSWFMSYSLHLSPSQTCGNLWNHVMTFNYRTIIPVCTKVFHYAYFTQFSVILCVYIFYIYYWLMCWKCALITYNIQTLLSSHCRLFTALQGMQTLSSDENSVRPSVSPSVRPSVKRVHSEKNGRKICQHFIPYEISFSL